MANINNPNGFTFNSMLSGQPTIKTGVLADSQTIAKGDALVISSGQLGIGLSNSPALYGVAAEAKVTDGAVADILFYPATKDTLFEAQCSGTFAESMVGADVDIEGATGVMQVNENATTEQVFHIVDYIRTDENAIGANTRVIGFFTRSQYIPTSTVI